MSVRKLALLADDSTTIIRMVSGMLDTFGFDVAAAYDGAEALEKALLATPDIILLDINMPKMDGFEACRRMRESDRLRSVPIVMITTRGDPPDLRRASESGHTTYLTKPFTSSQLRALLDRLMKR